MVLFWHFVVLPLLFPVVAYLVFRWRNRRFDRVSTDLDGPKQFPFIGCGHLFIGKSNEEQFAILNDITKTYPSPCRAWLGHLFLVFIDNPEDMQVVLNSPNCLEKADVYRFFRCEKGLFSSPASVWKVHRKLLSPCFSPVILASFVSIFNAKSAILVQRIEKHLGQKVFNINEDIARCTLDMICATTLGANMDLQSDEGTEYIKTVEELCELMNQRVYKVWLHPDFIYEKTKYFRSEKENYEKAYKMSRKVLKLKKEERSKSKSSVVVVENHKKPQIYIDQILRLAEETDIFDDAAIRDELDTIIAGGNETSALTLSHVMLMLAIHEDIQQKVYNEIVNVIGSSDPSRPVHNEHLAHLNYTEMVIKETMRLFPVGPVIGRTCTAPTKISKTTLPAGTTIILGVFNVHRNAKYWGPQVERFDPENFLPERAAQRHPYTYLPFSGGPRNCIGYKYGLMSMKIMMCHLLRTYRFRSPLKMEELQLNMSITLKIANKHLVQIVKRQSFCLFQLFFYQANLEGPKQYPFIGCGNLFIGKSNEEQFAILNDITKTYPSPCRAWLGHQFLVFIDNPEDLQATKELNTSKLSKFQSHASGSLAMWNMAFVYLSAVLIVLAAYYRWSRRKMLADVANMSGPPALPLFGHLYLLLKYTSTEAIFQNLKKISSAYPSPLCIHLGHLLHIAIYKPEEVQIVLNSPNCLGKPLQYNFFRVSKGLFSAPAQIWKGQRKILNVSFGPANLNSFAAIFNEKSAIFTELMEKHVAKGERNYNHEIALCMLDTIYSTAFGLNFDMQRTPDGEFYLGLQEEFMDLVTKRVFSPSMYPECIYRLTKAYKREMKILYDARQLTTKVMQARKADELLSTQFGTKQPEADLDGKKPQIFLDKLLELARENNQLTKEDIPEHLDTIIFAGNDTTATTMGNLLLMLAIYPDIQERVYQEIMQACPEENQFVSIEDVAKLSYTEMVCKETMRLFPVGPLIGRIATSDIKLDDRNTIPANTVVLCGIYQLHMDPEQWGPDPEQFNPDHFLPENVAQRHPYAYLPFSGGPRNCIGIRYAWLSMKIMIVHLLRKYRLTTSLTMDDITIKFSIIMKITNGCRIALEKRR
ncbi:uncharacterized protein LOC131680751 [Topomyia yanbarensis]|uniref:uncharacterized protein LOC131680751 n=1 Tax=Topomyia yanbarensis TaxID=2498891 RepID=UPI00273AEE36|nr:uncharacterized protein LOC131680751 [Topomyia yanbarensis]